MEQTLPARRGIEDSMWPKPRQVSHDKVRGIAVQGTVGGDGPDRRRRLQRATITVTVEYDPQVRTPDEVALDVEQLLRPHYSTGVARGRTWLWRAIRTHAWNRPSADVAVNLDPR